MREMGERGSNGADKGEGDRLFMGRNRGRRIQAQASQHPVVSQIFFFSVGGNRRPPNHRKKFLPHPTISKQRSSCNNAHQAVQQAVRMQPERAGAGVREAKPAIATTLFSLADDFSESGTTRSYECVVTGNLPLFTVGTPHKGPSEGVSTATSC